MTKKITRILRKYYDLYANKLDNWKEMDKFLTACNLPKLNQEEIEYMNRWVTTNNIKAVLKKFPTNKSPGLYGFPRKFQQSFKEKLTPILLNLFQKIFKRREDTQTHFMKPALS